MKKRTLLPALTLAVLLSTTILATAYRSSHPGQSALKALTAVKEENAQNDFEGELHGEFIWESLAKHLLFIKY